MKQRSEHQQLRHAVVATVDESLRHRQNILGFDFSLSRRPSSRHDLSGYREKAAAFAAQVTPAPVKKLRTKRELSWFKTSTEEERNYPNVMPLPSLKSLHDNFLNDPPLPARPSPIHEKAPVLHCTGAGRCSSLSTRVCALSEQAASMAIHSPILVAVEYQSTDCIG